MSSETPVADAMGRDRVARERFRRAVSRSVVASWSEVPHFAVSRNIEAAGLSARLSDAKRLQSGSTFTDILISTTTRAARSLPGLVPHHLGLAVAGPHGVAIAVLSDVDPDAIGDIAAKRADAVRRVREGKASQADMNVYPDLTLSNMGALGIDSFTGIVPPGQKMLVTTGRVHHVISADGSGSIPVIAVTCVADHRAFDGADLAVFLEHFQSASSWEHETESE
jgi:pyruvate dehydrogenase E2 component (dihydrolipoamide acetyltransferase)